MYFYHTMMLQTMYIPHCYATLNNTIIIMYLRTDSSENYQNSNIEAFNQQLFTSNKNPRNFHLQNAIAL